MLSFTFWRKHAKVSDHPLTIFCHFSLHTADIKARLIATHLSYVADLLPEAHESQPQELETEIEDGAIAGTLCFVPHSACFA